MSAAPCWLFRNSRSTATRAVNAARAFWAPRLPNRAKRDTKNSSRALQALKVPVATGVFQAHMSVEIVNDGPVTILLDSDKLF